MYLLSYGEIVGELKTSKKDYNEQQKRVRPLTRRDIALNKMPSCSVLTPCAQYGLQRCAIISADRDEVGQRASATKGNTPGNINTRRRFQRASKRK